MAKLLFVPFGVIAGLLSGLFARRLFSSAWSLIEKAEPPEAKQRNAHWSKLIAASALRGAIFATTKDALDHGSRRLFLKLTGSWPG